MNFGEIRFGRLQGIVIILEGLGISMLITLVCYRSIWAMAVAAAVIPIWWRVRKKQRRERQLRELKMQFREAMQSVSGALYAGYSLENAWRSARDDLYVIYGGETMMTKEMTAMLGRLSVEKNFAVLLRDFGERSNLQDVKAFCQVMEFAMKSGGDFAQIIQSSVQRISDQYEVEREIEAITAEKQLEYRIMLIVPIGIILYITFSSPGYLDVMYDTWIGRLVMTMCLGGYVGAILLARKLISVI